jgi:hypothetical protein
MSTTLMGTIASSPDPITCSPWPTKRLPWEQAVELIWKACSIAAIAAFALIVTSCTSDGGTEERATGTSAPAPAPSPTPSKPPKLPVSEARLGGKYDVKVFVTSNSFDSKPLKAQLFRFSPKCDQGACDVTVTGAMDFGFGLADRQSAGAEKRFEIRLANLGRSYQGTKIGYWASCQDEPDKDRWSFAIRVDKAMYVDDVLDGRPLVRDSSVPRSGGNSGWTSGVEIPVT